MKVKDIMTRDVRTLSAKDTLRKAAELFLTNSIDGAPIVDEGKRLLGLITKSHLLFALHGGQNPETPVGEIMTTHVTTVSPEDEVVSLFNIKVGRLPVLEDGQLVGIVTRTDLASAYHQYCFTMASEIDTLLNAIHNPVVSINSQGTVVLCNRAFLNALGLRSYDEIVGRHISTVSPNNKLLDVLATGRPEVAQRVQYGGKTYVANRSLIREGDNIVGAVGVLQDISELEAISQELQYSKTVSNELNAIIESSFDGIFVTDGQGKVLKVNKAYERITGIPVDQLLGRHMDELVETGFYNRSVSMQVISQREPITITQEVKGGKVILVTGNPIYDEDGQIFRVVTNVRDITELNQLQRELENVYSLSDRYRREIEELRQQIEAKGEMVIRSRKMQEIYDLAVRLAGVDSTVLLQGESGVGKEMVAEVIHRNSKRSEGPFIKINCGAIPENLIEAELFGYEGGAFTGAHKEGKAGVFEAADGGSIFLDEIGELPSPMQVKLLRVLQERAITRVGGVTPIAVDVRVIAATNRDLEAMVSQNKFRKDLYYRLNVVPVVIPPLRERREEIPALVFHFLKKYNSRYGLNCDLTEEVVKAMLEYDWPGNVRELENIIERMVVTARDQVIRADSLPPQMRCSRGRAKSCPVEIKPLKEAVDEVEKELLTAAFKKFRTTRRVAEALGINQSTVVRKAAKYGISIQE